ncbi:MAG: trehalose-6-phosphate synthase [Euryarchaeota archaeon]|nr:trehalose-6-phosphate synthase [Euryarchaeota archaeon]
MTGPGRLIVVSNREPYIHEKTKKGIRCKVPAGGLVTALDPIMQKTKGIWIAWGSGNADAETADEHGRIMVPEQCPSYTLRRVWLNPKEINEYYFGFANQVIWPVCHLFQENAQFYRNYWETFKKVNERFTQAVAEEARPDDNIWVQDVHFALMPAALRKELPENNIALFWHIPFPPWETFSCIPWRREILEGLLGADLLGFHTASYVANFLSGIQKEFPEAQVSASAVRFGGRTTRVRAFPIGIDYTAYRSQGDSESIKKRAIKMRRQMGVKHIILGIDRLDYTKGILNRLLAFERFLENNPHYLGRVSFIQVASPTRSAIAKYKDMKRYIEETVGRVNGRFQQPQWTPIIYINRHVATNEVLTLYRLADVAMVTPIIDGMNLVAKEYVTVNDSGVLILSEFAGASEEMGSAIIVNPYDVESMAHAISKAISMTPEQRTRHIEPLRQIVKEHDIFWWLYTFLKEWGVTVQGLEDLGEEVEKGPMPPPFIGLRRDTL